MSVCCVTLVGKLLIPARIVGTLHFPTSHAPVKTRDRLPPIVGTGSRLLSGQAPVKARDRFPLKHGTGYALELYDPATRLN